MRRRGAPRPNTAARHPKSWTSAHGHPFPTIPGPWNLRCPNLRRQAAAGRVLASAKKTLQTPKKTLISVKSGKSTASIRLDFGDCRFLRACKHSAKKKRFVATRIPRSRNRGKMVSDGQSSGGMWKLREAHPHSHENVVIARSDKACMQMYSKGRNMLTAASILAGDSSVGSESIEMTLITIVSTCSPYHSIITLVCELEQSTVEELSTIENVYAYTYSFMHIMYEQMNKCQQSRTVSSALASRPVQKQTKSEVIESILFSESTGLTTHYPTLWPLCCCH